MWKACGPRKLFLQPLHDILLILIYKSVFMPVATSFDINNSYQVISHALCNATVCTEMTSSNGITKSLFDFNYLILQ